MDGLNRNRPVAPSLRLALFIALIILTGCAASVPMVSPTPGEPVAATFAAQPLNAQAVPCSNRFVPHALNHTTTVAGENIGMYESNGSGLAINDLDGDGRLDLVLANLDGPNAIFWNLGGLRFQRQTLSHGDSRGVTIVDVDADGRQDIVFTRRFSKPTLWHNTGAADLQRRFVETTLPDVNNPFYTLTWGDLDRDGDLDLVAGSYDTALLKHEGQIFTQRGNGVGVFFYERQGETYIAHRLAEQADTLALALPDLNGDGRLDIIAGNDFIRPDGMWLQGDGEWLPIRPFKATTENTMSFDLGDIDNNGTDEILAMDMKPYSKDPATMAQWLPMMKMMTMPTSADDPQHAENTLQVRGDDGSWRNQAYERMLDASGWSWSSKFGDLDNDGDLDVYSVNGMIATGMFDHLPDHELVEPNMAFRNNGDGFFSAAPQWRLGITTSGRGMSMADLDGDGDLDIVVNNLRGPAMLLENRICGGSAVEVDLRWSQSLNPAAIGARLVLHTTTGAYYRDVRAASGYLSGDPSRIHIGLPNGSIPERLEVHWPDGRISFVGPVSVGTLVTVTR